MAFFVNQDLIIPPSTPTLRTMNPPGFNPRRYPELLPLLLDGTDSAEKRSLADDVHDRLLLKIIRGELPGGTELKSTQLARELNVSRTPVIQALGRLTTSGVVRQALNLRATVREGAENWLVDIHRMRRLLEPEATRSCVGRVPTAVLEDLAMLQEDARPARGKEWQTHARWLDHALHLVIAEYCGNLSIRETLRRCWSYKRLSYEAGNDSEAHLKRGYLQHAAILDALAAGSEDAAATLMAEHLDASAPSRPGQRIV
ncbi:MAG: GntR family transcriptional regulator [Verrucomicrobiales bacterium]|nr:GntR family transcriptional regulator [Verrucomicrobiales bacterium]